MDSPICQSCFHFHQHYIMDAQRCTAVNCGHCSYPHTKHRNADTKACQNYKARIDPVSLPDRDGVIHFLTTEVLQFVLSLELPPDLDNRG